MLLKIGSFDEIARIIKTNKQPIVIFGTGVIGKTVTQDILHQYNLSSFVKCFIDNDSSKWGMKTLIDNRSVQIYSPEILYSFSEKTTVLITMSRFMDVYEQLSKMSCTEKMTCYIIPMLCLSNFKKNKSEGIFNRKDLECIPKKINYMWIGNKEMPKYLQKCVDSWKRLCPDYEIICWNENNYDINKCHYMKDAYKDGKFGFVPDYARLDILYNYGGIYLDTDVELIKNIDDLLYQEAFCSVEKWQVINFGGCSGAIKGHLAIKRFLEVWGKREYYREDGSPDPISSGIVDTQVAIDNGYVINGENQNIMGMNIYTYDYFHPYDYMSGKLNITQNTYSIHHFNGGWLDENAKLVNMKTTENYDKIYRRAYGEINYCKLYNKNVG